MPQRREILKFLAVSPWLTGRSVAQPGAPLTELDHIAARQATSTHRGPLNAAVPLQGSASSLHSTATGFPNGSTGSAVRDRPQTQPVSMQVKRGRCVSPSDAQ